MKNLINILKNATILTIIIFALGINSVAQAQNDYKSYKGTIIDNETGKPVIFATIFATGSSVGTISNSEGEFVLVLKNSLTVTTIEVSHIGYKTEKISISDLRETGNVIKLKTSSLSLKEVVVRPYNPNEMLMEMLSKVKDNYATKANMMTGFYREAIKKRSNYIYISEAIVDIYKGGYGSDYDGDNVKIFKGRRSSRIKAADTIMVKLQGGPSISLLMDIMKNPYILFENENINKYEFKFGDMKIIDDKPIYVLEFTQKEKNAYPLYNGKLYINSATLALTAAEFSLNLEDIAEATRMFIQRKPLGLRFVPISTNYFIKYKEENGKYYFNYARYELNFTCDWKKRVFKSRYNIMAEMAVTDRDDKNIQKISYRDRINQNVVFADKVSAFSDPNFWGDNNYIEPDKSIEEALVKYAKWLKKNEKK